MPQAKTRRVIFQPATYRRLQRGLANGRGHPANAGPRPRIVAISRLLDERMPELLDNGGTIAKRVERLIDPDEDMGASSSGTCCGVCRTGGRWYRTAAVLFGSIYDQGIRYLTAAAMRCACKLS